jgi:hypothetical protein
MSRELEGDLLRFRTAGMDWPLHGLTMVGLARLDDLQACVESVVRDGVEGDLIEAGTWRGGASILMRATLDSLGEDGRTLWVADSFQGFPQAKRNRDGSYDLASDLAGCDFLAVPLDEVKENFARFGLGEGVRFVPGFFEDTLPLLPDRRWAVVRLDGDTYDATRLSLEALYPRLSAGGYLIIDDYGQIDPCREAVDDFRRDRQITEPIEAIDWSGSRWRRQTEPTPLPPSPDMRPPIAAGPEPARAVPREPANRVPAIEEVELQHELAVLQARLAATEAEIERLVGSPLHAPRRWLGRRLAQARHPRA